jgi:hypothetical protein
MDRYSIIHRGRFADASSDQLIELSIWLLRVAKEIVVMPVVCPALFVDTNHILNKVRVTSLDLPPLGVVTIPAISINGTRPYHRKIGSESCTGMLN